MATSERKASRKEQILQALAHMLEATPGGRITTAALAKEVGVSEAALYRHFPSKAKMFEGLIEFVEQSLFSRISMILKEEPDVYSPRRESFGHAGMGGALGWCDPVAGITIGYVMNRMDWRIRSPRSKALVRALYACEPILDAGR